MRSIQATIAVSADQRGTVQLPTDVEPGQYYVTIVFENTSKPWDGFPSLDIPWIWPDGYTFRREDIYDDDDE